MSTAFRNFKFGKKSRAAQQAVYRRNLYRLLTGPRGTTHCNNGHKHTLDNCWAKEGAIQCRVCEKEATEKQQNATKPEENAPTQPTEIQPDS